ncbi:hypothetical protein Trydic_g14111 [Trypoxylus dichotomus]
MRDKRCYVLILRWSKWSHTAPSPVDYKIPRTPRVYQIRWSDRDADLSARQGNLCGFAGSMRCGNGSIVSRCRTMIADVVAYLESGSRVRRILAGGSTEIPLVDRMTLERQFVVCFPILP